jgi:hypothetical protein
MTRIRLFTIAVLLSLSAPVWADLKTYDVAPEHQQEIYTALNSILNSSAPGVVNGASYGRVQQLPSGQILVNAEPETLQQVEQVLAAIRTRSATAAPRAALRYWGVLGMTPNAPAVDAVGSPPPAVLNEVLSELRRVHGELTFRVIGAAAVVTTSGQYGQIEGATLSVEQTAHVQGDTLNAEISMSLIGIAPPPIGVFNGGELELRTTLRRGEFVVLGESYFQSGAIEPSPDPVIAGPVFYIVHWEK